MGLRDSILRLEHQPNRCPVTPESKNLRHLLHGSKPDIYRVIYRVSEKQKRVVVVLGTARGAKF